MFKKITENINDSTERHARKHIIEELFYDFHTGRHQVYWMNFTRGIFFGFGTILGGTVLIALSIWILGQFVGFPYVGDYIRHIIEAMQSR